MEVATKEAIEEAERFLSQLKSELKPLKKNSKQKKVKEKKVPKIVINPRAAVEVYDDASPDATPRQTYQSPGTSGSSLGVTRNFDNDPGFSPSGTAKQSTRTAKPGSGLPSVEKGMDKSHRSKSAAAPPSKKRDLIENVSTALLKHSKSTESVRRSHNNSFENHEAVDDDFEDHEIVQEELNSALGAGSEREDLMTAPDGTFKKELRTTVLNTLLESRFDNVATLLANDEWADSHKDDLFDGRSASATTSHKPRLNPKRTVTPGMYAIADKLDVTRKPFVSILKKEVAATATPGKGVNRAIDYDALKPPGTGTLGAPSGADGANIVNVNPHDELTMCDISHPGTNDVASPSVSNALSTPFDPTTMCFGCWSAGVKRQCSIHEDVDMKMKPSQTMLLCRNWDLGVMRRRYRSEEIQEIFLKKSSSLRYDAKRKKFSTVSEQRHPVYRTLANLLNKYNSRLIVFIKVRRWLYSMADAVCAGKVKSGKTATTSQEMKERRSITNQMKLFAYARKVKHLLSLPPVTGTSFPELTGQVVHLLKHRDASTGDDMDIIQALPVPVPVKLYEAREYQLTVPRSIPMPSASAIAANDGSVQTSSHGYHVGVTTGGKVAQVPALNIFVETDHPAGWFERLTSSLSQFVVKNAQMQISAVTPMKGLELLRRTKRPPPASIKFATLGRKPCPGNFCVGGLAVEFLVSQLVSTYFPAQYGNLVATEQGIVSPGVSPEIAITFLSLLMGPVVQPYILRPVEHPLNYRKSPTITVNSLIAPEVKNHYGENRPEQTGEQDAHGFRTSAWTYHLYPLESTEAIVFTPGPEVVSLNGTGANRSITTHADTTYPFCEPSTKDNSTLDFYHLLLTGYISANKAQVFTALTVQEPGLFQKECKDGPMGHMVVTVYRSWAFCQKDSIQEYKTDDGISYWYHHRTGQTFWERPLYEEEKVSVLHGGLSLDMDHPEEPFVVHRGQEGAERRYLQGEFRKQMLTHHEVLPEAVKRRRAAGLAASVARERGIVPEGMPATMGLDQASKVVFPGDSVAGDEPDNGRVGMSDKMSIATTAHSSSAGGDYASINPRGISTANGEFPRPNTEQIRNGAPLDSARESIGSHESSESAVVNDQGRVRDMRTPNQQSMEGYRMGGDLDDIGEEPSEYGIAYHKPDPPPKNELDGMPGFKKAAEGTGLDPQMIMNLTGAMGKMMANMVDAASPQEMLQMGLGMGIALMQSNPVKDLVVTTTAAPEKDDIKRKGAMTFEELQAEELEKQADNDNRREGVMFAENGEMLCLPSNVEGMVVNEETGPAKNYNTKEFPVGLPRPNQDLASRKVLDKSEEGELKQKYNDMTNVQLTAYEEAREVKVHNPVATETPDEAPPKHLTDMYGMSPDEILREKYPVLVYPQLSTETEGGAPAEAAKHPAAGVGTSFVNKRDGDKQIMVKGSEVLRKAVMPLPVGFFEAITAKHVAKQTVDYLPQVPNLPQSRTVGRVKPRSAAVDWLAVNFDPWSAGKNPLSTEFVNSLATKAEKLFDKADGAAKALEEMDDLRQEAIPDAIIDVKDNVGLNKQRGEISKSQMLLQDYKKAASLARHSKLSEVEQLLNQPDWNVPIDYQDEHGNGLLHVCGQNGNKRLIKLCLRRGANLDIQNLNGNTPLHFLFAYKHDDVGQYLIKKGADNSLKNRYGLTCYEGLSAKELNQL